MKESKKQIQQLSEAHRAVHSAVSGINAMQDLLALKEQTGESSKLICVPSKRFSRVPLTEG